jgi:Flp pilus assembly pilin Flp
MSKTFFGRLRSDKKGATLVEYSVLVGVILVLAIASVRGVGGWVNNQWVALNTNLTAN